MIIEAPVNNGNGLRHPRPISHGGDEILVYSKRSFVDHQEYLIELTASFMAAELGWDDAVALETMRRGLALSEAALRDERLTPSAEVFTREGNVVGVSTQRLIILNTRARGDIPFLQHLLRAFKPEFRGGGRGTYSVQQAQIIHDQAEFYGHRTQVASGIRANQKAGIFLPDRYFPVDKLYSTDALMQEIMVRYYMHARANILGAVNFSTGVSSGDFPQLNRSYLPPEPEEDHSETWEIFRRMQREWKMRFPSRDALHGVGQLK